MLAIRQLKVNDLNLPLARDQDVPRLQVIVTDSKAMHRQKVISKLFSKEGFSAALGLRLVGCNLPLAKRQLIK